MNESLKPYDDYMRVHTKWVDNIPDHWEFKRLKDVLCERKERNNPVSTATILSLSAKSGVSLYTDRIDKSGNRPKDDLSLYNIAHENDLLVNCMNVVAGSAGVTKWHGAISPVYYALFLRNHDKGNIMYYHYLFRLYTFQRSLLGLGKGILMHETEEGKLNTVRMRIPMSNLNNVMLPLPPREEQDQIVRYLDYKLAQVAKLLKAKKRLIELLKEQKQAIINHAVTKGLNANAKTKPSGVEWLGDVPEGWEVVSLKSIAKISNGRDYAYAENGIIPVYGSGGIFSKTDKILYNGPSVLLGRKGTIDKPIYVESPFWSVDTAFYTHIGTSVLPLYFYFLCCQIDFKYYATKTALPSMTQTILNNIKFILPKISEQQAIVAHIESKAAAIDKAIAAAQREIDLITEYRTCLVADVVTGRVDVRGLTVPCVADDDVMVSVVDEEAEEIVD